LVGFAHRLSAASEGAYDITVAPLTNLWGFGPQKAPAVPPSSEQLARVQSQVGWEKIRVLESSGALQKTEPCVQMDLGSILQGYAVDRLCELLTREGIREFLVEVGGELRARGAWRVAIENPLEPGVRLRVLELRDAALATSALGRARRRGDAVRGGHILSPRLGIPVEGDLEQVSVAASTCLEADGWATALVASGWTAALDIAEREKLKVWALKTDQTLAELPVVDVGSSVGGAGAGDRQGR
jgi:thiamine biosynthesis lipoprotein